jgi:hypothetical protein
MHTWLYRLASSGFLMQGEASATDVAEIKISGLSTKIASNGLFIESTSISHVCEKSKSFFFHNNQ